MNQIYLILSLIFSWLFLCPTVVLAQLDTTYRMTERISREIAQKAKHFQLESTSMELIDLACIGNYEAALAVEDSMVVPIKVVDSVDEHMLDNYSMTEAIPYILERTKDERIVMLNRTRHAGIHRVFTYQLLSSLYEQGFRYLGLDELKPREAPLINERGYPTTKSSPYLREPVFGELVREAINMGFTIFSYGNPLTELEHRMPKTFLTAINIANLLKDDPQAKMIVLGDLLTTYENPRTQSINYFDKSAAQIVEKDTGIRPLVIEQVAMREHADFERENPFYGFIGYEKKPMIFVNDQYQSFVDPIHSDYFDIQVFHPRSRYTENRPEWLMMDGLRAYHKIKIPTSMRPPVLVAAYHADEDHSIAVPADILEVTDRDEPAFLILKPGDYVIKWLDRTGRELEEKKQF